MFQHLSFTVPQPSACGLRYAARFLPYGVRGMMQLAWLSEDARAKKVGGRWLFADKGIQDSADLEDLCDQAGITAADFIAAITKVAYELRVDVSGLIGGIFDMPNAISSALALAITTGDGLD